VRGVSGTLAVDCALDTPGVVGLGGEPAGFDAGIGVCVAPGTFDAEGVGELGGAGDAAEFVEAGDELPPAASGRAERKASERPSGDQRGEFEDCGLEVNCRGARLPSTPASQMFETRRFCL
jgi:hypothetical protein